MAEYDLTARMAENLDRHLVFPLLEFLQERILYADKDILKSKIQLLNITNIVDYAMDIHKSLYHSEDVPATMVERVAEVVARLKSLEETTTPTVKGLVMMLLKNMPLIQKGEKLTIRRMSMVKTPVATKCTKLAIIVEVSEEGAEDTGGAEDMGWEGDRLNLGSLRMIPMLLLANNMIGVVDIGMVISMCDGPQYWSSFKEVH